MKAPSQGTAKRTAIVSVAFRSLRMKVGIILAGFVSLLAVFGPLVAPHDPQAFISMPFAPPDHLLKFGGDSLGRDVFSQFLYGGRQILLLSVIAALIGVGLGALLGILAGFRGGRFDEFIMRSGDVVLAFPQVLLALLFISVTGPNLSVVVFLVAVGHAPRVARVMRGATLSVSERDYVKSATALGMPTWRIVVQEILPNVSGPLAVEVGLRLTYSIGLISALNFLGLGTQPPTPDWGLMINDNRIALTVQPWPVLLPVIAIALLTIGMNLISDALARASAGLDRQVNA